MRCNIVLLEQSYLACLYRFFIAMHCHHCFVLLALWGFANILYTFANSLPYTFKNSEQVRLNLP